MMQTNKFGLSREIPDATKRTVRSRAGFGCVICGSAVYQYEHVEPSFADAREHDPDKITLLCASCHDRVTRGIWSKRTVLAAMEKPMALQAGHSDFTLDVDSASQVVVKVGNTSFVGAKDIITIDGVRLLAVDIPEEPGTPLRISAAFYGRDDLPIARIVKNEWQGDTSAFDIELEGRVLSIRNAPNAIDLRLSVEPPNGVAIEKLNLRHLGKTVVGDREHGFTVATGEASYQIPADTTVVRQSPFWIRISDYRLSIGTDSAIQLRRPDGTQQALRGTIEVEGAKVEYVDPLQEDIPLPPGHRPGGKVIKMTKLTPEGKTASFGFEIPVRPLNSREATPAPKNTKKVGRNEPCPCGSGKKYKHCHGAT